MSKEIIKLNKQKQFKEMAGVKKLKEVKTITVETTLKSLDEAPAITLETVPLAPEVGEKMKSLFERKVLGAIKEIFRRKELDESVENNLSKGLESSPEFVSANNKIDKKRNWLVVRIDNFLSSDVQRISEEAVGELTSDLKKEIEDISGNDLKNDLNKVVDEAALDLKNINEEDADTLLIQNTETTKNSADAKIDYPPYVFDEAAQQAMTELESEIPDQFTRGIYNKLAEGNKRILLDHLVDNPSKQISDIIELPTVSDANDNVWAFSDNGYLMQLSNKDEARVDGGINVESELAVYNLIFPDGSFVIQNLSFKKAYELLKQESAKYQQEIIKELNQSEEPKKELLENDQESDNVIENKTDNKEEEMNELMDQILEDKKNIDAGKEKEAEFFDNFGKKKKIKLNDVRSKINLNPEPIAEIKPTEDEVANPTESIQAVSSPDNLIEVDVEDSAVNPADNLVVGDGNELEIINSSESLEGKEYEPSELFDKYVYSQLGELNRKILPAERLGAINRSEVTAFTFERIIEANDYAVTFSSVGYLMCLTNIEDVKDEKGINTTSSEARYQVISPYGFVIVENLDYSNALDKVFELSKSYLDKLNADFEENKEAIEQKFNSTENNELIEISEEDEGSEPGELVEINIDEKKDNNAIEISGEESFANPFNKNISDYAESIGIKPEELAANQEFLALMPEQQQFVLKTLRRSTMAKVKVEAYENFHKEKASFNVAANTVQEPESKSFWKSLGYGLNKGAHLMASKGFWQGIGYNANQNFHKERHKVEAIKNIENQGLKGYGETELAWLVDVVKSGPEIKTSEYGEVFVNFLNESMFDEKDGEEINRYNDIARAYIGYVPQKNEEDPRDQMLRELDAIRYRLVSEANSWDEGSYFNRKFLKSRNDIELIRFLSADRKTEVALDKLAGNSMTGLSKTKSFISSHKDKAGYASLGFALRTGTKFALANSATLASAITYSVGPMAAAIVGTFRGYNNAKKDLFEKEDLAKLGINDEGGLVKSKNKAVGKEVSENGGFVNFGLKEKLDELVYYYRYPSSYVSRQVGSAKEKLEAMSSSDLDNMLRDRLLARIHYTELKMKREEIDYGSIKERNVNYCNLVNSISEAKMSIGLNTYENIHSRLSTGFSTLDSNDQSLFFKRQNNIESAFDDDAYSHFAGLNKYKGKTDFEKKSDENDEQYVARLNNDKDFLAYKKWATDARRLEKISEAGLELRLNSFLNCQEEKQISKEYKYLHKKAAAGAVMGASFAAAGAFVAEQLGITDFLSENFHKVIEATKNIFHAGGNATVAAEMLSPGQASSGSNISEQVGATSQVVGSTQNSVTLENSIPAAGSSSNVQEVVTNNPSSSVSNEATSVVNESTYTDEISNQELHGKSDSVWRSAREIFKNHAEELGYKGDVSDTRAVSNWAEIQTANAMQNSGDIADKIVFEGNKVELIQDGDGFKVNLEQGSGYKPVVISETVSSNPNVTESSSVITEPSTEIPVKPVTEITPTEVISQEVVDGKAAASNVKEMLDTSNRAAKLADGLYSNNSNFRTEADFLKQIAENNNGAKLSPNQVAEAKSIWESFKSNNDYNILRRRLLSFENSFSTSSSSNIAEASLDNVVATSPVETPTTNIIDTKSIASDLHVKPESLSRVGDDLVYKGKNNSSLIFDSKNNGIKEAIDASGQKIPKNFIQEALGGKKIGKFSRNGGLEKLLGSWNELKANDKLMYNSLDWFSNNKLSPEDLLLQVKGLYQSNVDNVFVDFDHKSLVTSDGHKFDLTLKGIKKLVAFLPKN